MQRNTKSFFLVVEGLDGSGKTELVRQLARVLRNSYPENVLLTFEPYDPSCAGLFIRQVLTHHMKTSQRTLALAFAVNRSDHIEREILPFLKRDERMVICDRYYLSSLVYQSGILSMDEVMELNAGAITPDLTIFLDASTATCMQRMRRRQQKKELFESNFERTRQKYDEAIEFLSRRGERIVRVNADMDITGVVNQVLETLSTEGPEWLMPQPLLLLEDLSPLDVFTLNGEVEGHEDFKLIEFMRDLTELWEHSSINFESELVTLLNVLRTTVVEKVDKFKLDDLGWLFLGFVKQAGYRFVGSLPWTDMCAYQLEYVMPMQLLQQGTVLLLDASHRYDIITTQKLPHIRGSSDFMFFLDASRSHQAGATYTKEMLNYINEDISSLSPSIRVITRLDIARYLLKETLKRLEEKRPDILGAFPHLNEVVKASTVVWDSDVNEVRNQLTTA